MREKMAAMQREIEEFVATLNHEMATRFRQPQPPEQTSLIPVVDIPPVEGKANAKSRNKRRS